MSEKTDSHGHQRITADSLTTAHLEKSLTTAHLKQQLEQPPQNSLGGNPGTPVPAQPNESDQKP